jgi:toxic protein SymE
MNDTMAIIRTLPVQQAQPARRLTICHKHFARADHRYVSYPDLRLCGKWLQRCGFQGGDVVHITCQPNQLIITRAGRWDDSAATTAAHHQSQPWLPGQDAEQEEAFSG